MTPAGRPAAEVRGLVHRFGGGRGGDGRGAGVPALDGVDVAVGQAEFVSLVGPSGCGKSTLLKVLAGVLVPTAGTAEVDGRSVVGRPGRTAYMPQKDLLLPWRRTLDNATLGAELHGTTRAEAQARAVPLLERFGLAGFERAWPDELSGGMRQRVALLRTFLLDRRVLLLDEPFGALDAITRRRMYAWLETVWLHDRRSVLFVTHDVEEALTLSDRLHVLSARPGRVVDTVDVGFSRPRSADIIGDPDFVALRRRVLAALGG